MRYSFFILTFFLSLDLFGQTNLVINPDFEDTMICASNSIVTKTTTWYSPVRYSSPDYFYPTMPGNLGCFAMNPQDWGGGSYFNNWGNQFPRSGVAFIGFAVAGGTELVAGKLSDTLQPGKSYEVSAYTSLGETYFNQGGQGLDLIQFCFMRDSLVNYDFVNYWQFLGTLNPTAGNQAGNYLTDTSSWMLVRDTFVASGGERYFVVGNIDTANTQYFNSQSPTPCYYYFDDFDVHCIDCTSDTSEPPVYPEITITPTLTQGELLLTGEFPTGTKFEVYDVLGQLVFYDELQSGNQTQSVFLPLGAGIYTCRVMAEGSLLKAEKVVVVK
jgi:hypothetical protein